MAWTGTSRDTEMQVQVLPGCRWLLMGAGGYQGQGLHHFEQPAFDEYQLVFSRSHLPKLYYGAVLFKVYDCFKTLFLLFCLVHAHCKNIKYYRKYNLHCRSRPCCPQGRTSVVVVLLVLFLWVLHTRIYILLSLFPKMRWYSIYLIYILLYVNVSYVINI